MTVSRAVEHVLVAVARLSWPIFQSINRRIPARRLHPAWARPVPEEQRTNQTSARLAAEHRFTLPGMCRCLCLRSAYCSPANQVGVV